VLSELNIGLGVAALAAQIVVGLMFVVGGLTKLMRWRELRGIVRGYRLLHSALVPLAVALLPPVELLVGATLIVGVAAPWSPLSAASLLVIFAAAMAINLRRGRTEIDCGCFGATLRQRLDWRMVWLNLFLAILLLGSAVSAAPVTAQLWVAALPAGIVLFILYLALNATWALDASRRRVFS
jgi:uncharacterized membrane protein YphA (DoxX/SURF4 family)